MKKLFISALALAAFTACSQEEIVEQQASTAIAFDGAFVENATRAAEDPSTTTNGKNPITAFDVWGFMDETQGLVFNQQRVTGSKAEGWSYSPLQYWLPGHTYYFAAVSPVDDANVKVNGTPNTYGLGTIEFTNEDGSTDLLYAATSVSTENMKIGQKMDPVNLTFNHLLSKVKFSFTNGFLADNYSIKVSNIVMEVPAKGSIDLAADKWWEGCKWNTENADKKYISFGDMNDGNYLGAGGKSECDYERLTIPATAAMEYVVTFDVALKVGNKVGYEGSLSTTIKGAELEIGKAYNFHATLDQTNIAGTALMPIKFEVFEVKTWEQGNYNGDPLLTKVIDVKSEDDLFAALNGTLSRSTKPETVNIRLYNDINVTKTVLIEGQTANIDLNGHKLSSTSWVEGDQSVNSYVFKVANTGKLNLSGNGNVEPADCQYAMAVWAAGGKVTIENGTYINGGEGSDLIYASAGGEVVINGGTFKAGEKQPGTQGTNNKRSALNLKGDNSGCKITVYGGEFLGFDPANNLSENPAVNFVADGYISIKDGENYVVCPAQTLQTVSSAEELQNALISGGSNIVLGQNITIDETIIVKANKAKSTLNLNGNTIANKVENTATDVIIVEAGANLTIDGEGTIEAVTGNDGYAVISEGVLTINGGTFKSGVDANGDPNAVIYARGNGKVYVNGGTFPNENKSKYVLNKKDADRANTVIEVKGGKFQNFNPGDNAAENYPTNFLAVGYYSYAVDETWFAVEKNK